MNIGERLHQVRNLHGLTQEQMVAGIISKSQYWRIEKESNAIRASSLIKILNQNKISVLKFLKILMIQELKEESCKIWLLMLILHVIIKN